MPCTDARAHLAPPSRSSDRRGRHKPKRDLPVCSVLLSDVKVGGPLQPLLRHLTTTHRVYRTSSFRHIVNKRFADRRVPSRVQFPRGMAAASVALKIPAVASEGRSSPSLGGVRSPSGPADAVRSCHQRPPIWDAEGSGSDLEARRSRAKDRPQAREGRRWIGVCAGLPWRSTATARNALGAVVQSRVSGGEVG
jgi:hypothetical protein